MELFRIVALVIQRLGLWHWNQSEDLRDYPVFRRILWPLLLVSVGIGWGATSYEIKSLFVWAGIALACFYLVHFVARYPIILGEVAIILFGSDKPNLRQKIAEAAQTFAGKVFAPAMLAVITVGLMVRWFPAHEALFELFGLLVVCAGIIAWRVFYPDPSGQVWKTLTIWVLLLTLAELLLRATYPGEAEMANLFREIGFSPSPDSLFFAPWWRTHARALMFIAAVVGIITFLIAFSRKGDKKSAGKTGEKVKGLFATMVFLLIVGAALVTGAYLAIYAFTGGKGLSWGSAPAASASVAAAGFELAIPKGSSRTPAVRVAEGRTISLRYVGGLKGPQDAAGTPEALEYARVIVEPIRGEAYPLGDWPREGGRLAKATAFTMPRSGMVWLKMASPEPHVVSPVLFSMTIW